MRRWIKSTETEGEPVVWISGMGIVVEVSRHRGDAGWSVCVTPQSGGRYTMATLPTWQEAVDVAGRIILPGAKVMSCG